MEENLKQHVGMVVEEQGQVLIAFRPETIDYIAQILKIKDGDVVVIEDGTDADTDSPMVMVSKLN